MRRSMTAWIPGSGEGRSPLAVPIRRSLGPPSAARRQNGLHQHSRHYLIDLRNRFEVASNPDPPMDDVMVLADYAFGERCRKDASKRLVAGVIGEYGVPGRRMLENYRRWARDTELVGRALRCAAAA